MNELEKFKKENDLTGLLKHNKELLERLKEEPFVKDDVKNTIMESLEIIDQLLKK